LDVPSYEVFAIKFGQREVRRSENFIGGDPHDGPMPVAYYVWLIRGPSRNLLVDVGFSAAVADRRGRERLCEPASVLPRLGVAPESLHDVIVTHLHWDHVGNFAHYPNARFHLQDAEMAYATGRHMRRERLAGAYELDHVLDMVRLVYRDRVEFHNGAEEIVPGVWVHHLPGHTAGIQSVRVMTRRGWVVLASDASHHYEHMETYRCYPSVLDIGGVVDGYDMLRKLASTPNHIIPGHDPLVMQRYPAASPELTGIAVRLDVPPTS
jgi:glyoxylase-like metal-dependent hydrolase (beta-lactamase superfamily II)